MTNHSTLVVQRQTVHIKCPKCEMIQRAEVETYKGEPWPRYVHTCIICEYVITESEWNEVQP